MKGEIVGIRLRRCGNCGPKWPGGQVFGPRSTAGHTTVWVNTATWVVHRQAPYWRRPTKWTACGMLPLDTLVKADVHRLMKGAPQ